MSYDTVIEEGKRFPYFQSTPVPYFNVTMQDTFWAPRQKTIREVTVPWATRHFDRAGGVATFREHPGTYVTDIRIGDMEANKFIEAMAAVVGLERDSAIEGLLEAWGEKFIDSQGADGYVTFAWPLGADPKWRWKPHWASHEDYAIGHYLESGIGYKESTGNSALYESAVRAIDNMVGAFLGSDRAFAPGHPEIEQALMRLYTLTGDTKYLRLCGWFIEQRGHHDGRRSFGKDGQDHIPVREQRTLEGHAVRAAFLFNGVTEYVGATGDAGLREAVLATWKDFVEHKMYLHGGGGNQSTKFEGYSSKPNFIPPDDCYGESCSVFGNFQWAHNLFRLTGDAAYIDVAERMIYNAFSAALSLTGDRFFYLNVMQQFQPVLRFDWHVCPCCPPNIVKLFSKIGGFLYSTDDDGIFIKHYGASEAKILFGGGVRLTQRTNYPWSGDVTIEVVPAVPSEFTLRLRVPAWAASYNLSINGQVVEAVSEKGWLSIRRVWNSGDTVALHLPMSIERITMPPQFKEYANLVAIQRGPIVYCLEEQDATLALWSGALPKEAECIAEHRPDFLGGVTVLRTEIQLPDSFSGVDTAIPVMFVPYGVWNNRTPGAMKVWLLSQKRHLGLASAMSWFPEDPPGEGVDVKWDGTAVTETQAADVELL